MKLIDGVEKEIEQLEKMLEKDDKELIACHRALRWAIGDATSPPSEVYRKEAKKKAERLIYNVEGCSFLRVNSLQKCNSHTLHTPLFRTF